MVLSLTWALEYVGMQDVLRIERKAERLPSTMEARLNKLLRPGQKLNLLSPEF